MGARVEEPGILNFDIPPGRFIVILLITFDFQRFLTLELCHNPYIIELISVGFVVPIRCH